MSQAPAATIATLRRRAELTRSLRSFFDTEGFLEVETPAWSADTTVDAWIEPVACTLPPIGRGFLQTSPEFHMKRLLAAGSGNIWQLSRAFRGGEAGGLHNPEFAILEWYAVDEDHQGAMARTERLVRLLIPGLPETPFPRVRYWDAMRETCGIDVASISDDELARLAVTFGDDGSPATPRDDRLNWLLAENVEPHLAELPAVFLTDYPASQAALAKTRGENPPVAERFELYVHGIEVANGYHELTDPEELRHRFERENQRRHAVGLCKLPVESRLLAAMDAGLPDAAGVAVGWDRVVMQALGFDDVRNVMAFPAHHA